MAFFAEEFVLYFFFGYLNDVDSSSILLWSMVVVLCLVCLNLVTTWKYDYMQKIGLASGASRLHFV